MKIRLLFLPVLVSTLVTLHLPASAQTGGRPNLLKNPSFEEGLSGWKHKAFNSNGSVKTDSEEKRTGAQAIYLENTSPDDNFLTQDIPVKPKTRYRLTGYIKTRDVTGQGGGATLALAGGFEKSEVIEGTKSWTKVTLEFESGPHEQITLGARLGHHGRLSKGKAWFDDITLVELGASRKR